MAEWNARQYLKFEDERTRPARDLLAQVPLTEVASFADLGCGPGNSTELIVARYPKARALGVDNDPDMLAAARRRLPTIALENADLSRWAPEASFDLLYSNATLQWVPDHAHLLPRLMGRLTPGGVLAIQMPDNLDRPSHSEMRATAAAGPWAAKIAAAGGMRDAVGSIGEYYDLLAPLSARVELWHTIYQHPLSGIPAITEWFKGSGLRPFLAPLTEAERRDFIADYEARLARSYQVRADGKVLLPFPRLFILAVRA